MSAAPDVRAWLSARQPVPPVTIGAHIAAEATKHGGVPAERLGRAGVALLQRVVATPGGGRELALDLLSADALVTYAFEAQAEEDVDELIALADRLSTRGDLA